MDSLNLWEVKITQILTKIVKIGKTYIINCQLRKSSVFYICT